MWCHVCAQPVAKHLSFDDIIATARDRASKPYDAPGAASLPEELRGDKLNYDSYREIRFRHDKALWMKEELPFRLEFFHPGYLYQTPVSIYEFNATHVQPIRFVQDFFDYGKLILPKKVPADTGYAGFKLLYPLNSSNRWDELASFLGASYFRCLGKDQRYGQSARGLAINSGEPDRPEEFPVFTRWWLGKPEKQANTLRLYALLESPSAAGAYDFLLRPGENTVVDIDSVLFLREGATTNLKTIGLSPLTSMFWFGENSERKPDDYRPEVHDSDGLLVRLENDEFIWRPLNNPPALVHQTISAPNVRGFGLLQRDRQFADYQDLFNKYHRVPSVWIEPRGNWGNGEVHLVELPAHGEGADNIVAFWTPASRPARMEPFRFGYTLFWTMEPHVSEPESKFPLLRVAQTRTGVDSRDPTKRQFVIDFSSSAPGPKPQAQVHCDHGKAAVSDVQVFENELSKGWRVFFSIKPDAAQRENVDIECSLERLEQVSGQTNAANRASETWRYAWKPSQKIEAH